jgi:acetolactate synthase-1/2/3 large subunit
MRVADYIFKFLQEKHVETVYSVSGRGALFLTDAIAKNGQIKNIATHHEQAAAFAAVAEAQYSGKIGVCLVSTGCASTNAITGVLSAWQDNIPCVFISGQNTLNETSNYTGISLRTYGQQEANIVPLVKSITKYSTMVHSPNDIVKIMHEAFFLATEGRPGPVWIDIPLDIQSSSVEFNENEVDFTYKKPIINSESIQLVSKLLHKAKKPVVLIGSGIRGAGAELELINFIERNSIPLVYSNSAPDLYGSRNELSIGSIGAMGASRAGNFTVQNSDLLLVLGNRLSSYSTGVDFCDFARDAVILVVDIDTVEHSKKSVKIDHYIHADVKEFLIQLNQISIDSDFSQWIGKCIHWKKKFNKIEDQYRHSHKIDLYELTEVLSNTLPDDSTIVTDSGFIEVILPTNFKFGRNQRIIHPISQGAMGFALPGAIGAYHANPNSSIFVVVGDGSIMMNLQELQTIKHNNIPVKIIVVNNNVYGIIRRRQEELFRKRTIGTDPSNGVSCPNFKSVAAAFDFHYVRIDKSENLYNGILEIQKFTTPVICEIFCRDDQSYIEVGMAKDKNGKFVRRPLEDQAPFLDREIFLSEMLIEPIKQ